MISYQSCSQKNTRNNIHGSTGLDRSELEQCDILVMIESQMKAEVAMGGQESKKCQS